MEVTGFKLVTAGLLLLQADSSKHIVSETIFLSEVRCRQRLHGVRDE